MPSRPWPVSLAVREGLVNAGSARWLGVLVVVTTAFLLAGLGASNAVDVSRLVDAERTWIEAGAYVYLVEAGTETEGIAVADCERLSEVDGVNGSFAVTITNQVAWPVSAPGSESAFAQVSPGVYEFFGLTAPQGADVIVTPGVVYRAGLSAGESTLLRLANSPDSDGTVTRRVMVSLVESPILTEPISGAYLSAELVSGTAGQCFVSTDAAHASTIEPYLAAALSSNPTTPAIVRPRLPASTYGVDFKTAYSTRVLGWAWVATAVVLIALWTLVQVNRRIRMAIYATFGAHRRARLTIQMTEWVSLTGVGALWGWSIGLMLSIGLGADIGIALTQVTFHVIAAWSCGGIGAVLVGLWPVGTLLDSLKDRS